MSATINLTASDLTGNRSEPITCDANSPVADVIDRALTELNLPRYDASGAELIYSARLDRTSAQLYPSQSLSDAEVEADDVLRLEPEISAGGSP